MSVLRVNNKGSLYMLLLGPSSKRDFLYGDMHKSNKSAYYSQV